MSIRKTSTEIAMQAAGMLMRKCLDKWDPIQKTIDTVIAQTTKSQTVPIVESIKQVDECSPCKHCANMIGTISGMLDNQGIPYRDDSGRDLSTWDRIFVVLNMIDDSSDDELMN